MLEKRSVSASNITSFCVYQILALEGSSQFPLRSSASTLLGSMTHLVI